MEANVSEEMKSCGRVQREVDASQGSSEGHLVKRKRVNKKKRASRVQREADASQGSSERHRVKRKRVKKKRVSRLPYAAQRQIDGGSNRGRVKHIRDTHARLVAILKETDLEHAKIALEFYEKSQDAEFEVLEVLYKSGSRLQHPESESDQYWCHISFIAKPKNVDCSDVSPKHFFGELFVDDCSEKVHATYCSTFEPSDDPGFNHGCILCRRHQKFHPTNGYCVGRPPWYIPKVVYGPVPPAYTNHLET
ncbi:uncharacterized protein [Euphorbia lathyris]|uniref:uncharacterized protein isoform X2 n=1 Tax=Euphorbia lathyris TaxID=212925 RepID=UPI0033136B6F